MLTPDDPVLRVEAAAPRGADVATVDIASIENPKGQEFVLVVLLRGAGGGPPVEAGGIGPYPPDRPGKFRLRLPDSATDELRDGPVQLVVRLQAADARRELEQPLSVVVRSLGLEASD